jgi:hypothetical protein
VGGHFSSFFIRKIKHLQHEVSLVTGLAPEACRQPLVVEFTTRASRRFWCV